MMLTQHFTWVWLAHVVAIEAVPVPEDHVRGVDVGLQLLDVEHMVLLRDGLHGPDVHHLTAHGSSCMAPTPLNLGHNTDQNVVEILWSYTYEVLLFWGMLF